jgi:thiosulfate reductase cytochrome b subunit
MVGAEANRVRARNRREQPVAVRALHWANAALLAVMAGSGLQILAAYPEMGPQGARYGWYPLAGWVAPGWARVGGWLAAGRHWHFAFGWFFAGVGVLYLLWLGASGEWRRRLFLPRRDLPSALLTARSYLALRNPPPRPGELYNGLQRLAYTGALAAGAMEVLTGLVLYKPVQLGPLAALFGGYDAARVIHFLVLAFLVLFTAGHVVMVLAHPRALASIFTGGPREGGEGG